MASIGNTIHNSLKSDLDKSSKDVSEHKDRRATDHSHGDDAGVSTSMFG